MKPSTALELDDSPRLSTNPFRWGAGMARGAWWRLKKRSDAWLAIDPSIRCEFRYATISLGHDVRLGRGVTLQILSLPDRALTPLRIGDRTRIGADTRLIAKSGISIGADCVISWKCTILDSDFHRLSYDGERYQPETASIAIGEHVFIGCNSTILKGVSIGDGAVVAAGSLVTAEVPANMLVAGVPAKPVRPVINWR